MREGQGQAKVGGAWPIQFLTRGARAHAYVLVNSLRVAPTLMRTYLVNSLRVELALETIPYAWGKRHYLGF